MGDTTNKAPALASNPGLGSEKRTNHTTRPLKWRRVLAALASGKSYNRFQAERELHDHCLHSTVSGLQRKGIVILRRFETVPGYLGERTEVCRYWIASESVEKARELLNGRGSITPTGAKLSVPDANTGV